ncbi:MAG: MEDS domain-containing protein, partial [Candidatus Acidiferrales bacterium]
MSATNISSLDTENSRKPGAIDRLVPAHIVQFYKEDRALITAVARYIASALSGADRVIVIATEAHSEELAGELYANGADLAAAIEQGRYQSIDAREAMSHFMADGMPDGPRFIRMMSAVIDRSRSASRSEHPCVAIFGEMVALLWAEGNQAAAIRLEELWNDLAKVQSFTL